MTFHPTSGHLGNVLKVRPQVRDLVVVDNGSSEPALAPFRGASRTTGFHLIENGSNLGVAAAINRGLHWAAARGCEWVALFDQDSTASGGMIAAMLAAYDRDPDRGSIGLLAPLCVDRASGHALLVERSATGRILTAATSGSLIPAAVFARCGWFREDFFIDQVDFEFCLRILCAGYRIVQCNEAKLIHSVGERREYDVAGKHLLTSTHHNAARRYYIIRNRVAIVRSYWRQFPAYCFLLLRLTLKDTIKILLVERKKLRKLRNIVKGLVDGALGRMGKRLEL